jgi:FtsK/SpoIIIE family
MGSDNELKGLWQAIGAICGAGVVCFGLLDNLAIHQQVLLMSGIMLAYAIYAFPVKPKAQATSYAPVIAPMPVYQPQAPAPSYVAPEQVATQAKQVAAPGASTDEMRFINRLLAAKAETDKNFLFQAVNATRTPDYIVYNLESPLGTPTNALRSYCPQLAAAIYKMRNGGEKVTVTFNEQPPYLRVSTADRSIVPWSSRAKSAPQHTAQLGIIFDGAQARYLTNNMADTNGWFLAVFSSSGGGKSNMINCAVLSLLENLDPAQNEFYFIDLDSNQFERYRKLPHTRFVARTHDEALAILQYLVKLVEQDWNMSNTVHRYLVIDELQIITTKSEHSDEMITLLETMAQQARKHRNSIITGTQDPTGDNFPGGLQRNVAAVAAGKTKDDSYLVRFLSIDGASALRGKGDLIYSGETGLVNFKGFYLSPQDMTQTVDAICAKWGEDTSTIPFVDEPTADRQASAGSDESQPIVLSKPIVKPSGVAADAEKLLPYLADALGANGKLKHGVGSSLLEVLYGETVPNAGAFSRRLKDAVEYAVNNFEIE